MEVFLRRELLPMVTDVRRDAVSCGIGNVIGNKGGVGISFEYAGARLCFLNAHLAAHTENVKQRNADFHRIVKTLFAPRGSGRGDARSGGKRKRKGNAVAPVDDAPSSPQSDAVTPIDPVRPTPQTPSLLVVSSNARDGAPPTASTCASLSAILTIASRVIVAPWTCSWSAACWTSCAPTTNSPSRKTPGGCSMGGTRATSLSHRRTSSTAGRLTRTTHRKNSVCRRGRTGCCGEQPGREEYVATRRQRCTRQPLG